MLISFPIENKAVGVENEEVLAVAADTETIEVLADDDVTGAQADTRSRVVTIDNRDSGDTIKLRVPVTTQLSAVIEKMYAEFRLTRQSDDRLTCRHNGEDVFQFAHETLERYLDQGHCPDLRWSFVGDTGGA